jgi:phenylalanyl-tRNA synthetase beta chain
LVEAGVTETYTESGCGRREIEAFGLDKEKLVTLVNPVNPDYVYARPSLLPNLLKTLSLNSWSSDAQLFEIGNVFPTKEIEITRLGLACYGVQETLLAKFIPKASITVINADQPIAKTFKLRRVVTVAEVSLDQFLGKITAELRIVPDKINYRPVSPYPPAVRDIALIVDSSVRPRDIEEAISTMAKPIITIELFDQFKSDRFGSDKQSLAFHIVYQSLNKTLENREVDELHQKITNLISNQFQAKVR